MARYFLAILLPDDAKDRLVEAQPSAMPGIRLIGRQELHLTLLFLAELSPQSVEVVRMALSRMNLSALTLSINGFGLFSGEGKATVLWARVEKSSALDALHESIGTRLTDAIDFQPEQRRYSPHISLARANDPAASDVVEKHAEKNEDLELPSVACDRLALFSSVFVDGIPKYREEAVFYLR